jgi:hypothetical protein
LLFQLHERTKTTAAWSMVGITTCQYSIHLYRFL